MEKLLPNGSIVLLNGGNKRLMIYGRKQLVVDEEQADLVEDAVDTTMFDYIGVPYPEGYINQEFSYAFNHSDIQDIIFQGYEDDEEDAFQSILERV
jgi:hypothetical protein